MSKIKRMLGMLLAVVMCLGTLAPAAFAEDDGSYPDDHRYYGTVTVYLHDQANKSIPIPGATFQVLNSKGAIVDTMVTDANGMAQSIQLEVGNYTVCQASTVGAYVPDATPQPVSIEMGRDTDLNFYNSKRLAVVITAYDEKGNALANVPYDVYNDQGNVVAHVVTSAAGVAVTGDLEPGKYTVVETVVPEGYTLNSNLRAYVTITTGLPGNTHFVHVAQTIIRIMTRDPNGNPIAGATYDVINMDGSFKNHYTADANGEVVTEELKPGVYMVKQVTAPDGTTLDNTTRTIKVVTGVTPEPAIFWNYAKGSIVIESEVQDQGIGLAGCYYVVEASDGTELYRGTTDDTGLLSTGKLTPGNYTVKLLGVPSGYEVMPREKTVVVSLEDSTPARFTFTVKHSIVIQLTDYDAPTVGLAGSKFLVEQVGGQFTTELVTNEAGEAMTGVLPAGKYLVHQESAPNGYILDRSYQWVEIGKDHNSIVHFTNRRISGLVVKCLEEGTSRGIAGGTFEVYEENGKLVGSYVSDATGVIQVNDLPSGTYLVKEVSVPGSYTARTTTQKVTITTNEPSTLEFWHTAKSALTINLYDSVTRARLNGAMVRVTKENGDFVGDYKLNDGGQVIIPSLDAGVYIVTQTTAPKGYLLDSTPHRVTIKDNQATVLDIYNEILTGLRIINTCEQDGKPIGGSTFKVTTYNGKLVGNFTTNSAGIINVHLDPGTYTVYQTHVENGYVLNENVWNVVIDTEVDTKLEVENKAESNIVVHVVDSESGAGLYGVELEIVDQKNNFIGRFTTDNTGSVYLTDVLVEGRYQVRLLTVPSNYTKDTVAKTIVIETGETTELTWRLNGVQGQVCIATFSGEDNAMMNIRKNTRLSGAVYTIFNASGKQVGIIQGDINGNAYSGALPVGTYYIQQTVAPVGWQVNATRFTVNVSSVNDNIHVEVYNKAASFNVTAEAHGQPTAVAGGQLKYYFNIKNNSTCAINNFFISIKLPTDAVRATTFYTGTFGGTATTYYLEYRTNLNGYRTLASGLNSKSNYQYDVSTQGLGLSNGEYVTDIRMVFTTAVAGFRESMAPTLDTYVLSTVATGYQATLRVEVGGLVDAYHNNMSMGGQWGTTTGSTLYPSGSLGNGGGNGTFSTNASSVTTYIYGYAKNVLPWQLPKTGY